MADNVTAPFTGSGDATPVFGSDNIGGVNYVRDKLVWGPDGTVNDADDAAGKRLPVLSTGSAVTVTTTVTRPADTNAYAANDAWSSSTSAPAAITFSNCFRQSGGSSLLTSMQVIDSANQTTLLQGELWLFDTAPTVINDNAAFTITDGEYQTVVAKIPFSIDSAGNSAAGASGNAGCFIVGINTLITGVSSANLTGLIKVINAYTPVSGESLMFRLNLLEVT